MRGRAKSVLRDAIRTFGLDVVEDALRDIQHEQNTAECTIVVSKGIHNYPHNVLRGDIHYFYEGMIDFNDKKKTISLIDVSVQDLKDFLLSKKFSKINILISGHPFMCMIVKLVCYRVYRYDTNDIVYHDNGQYSSFQYAVRENI